MRLIRSVLLAFLLVEPARAIDIPIESLDGLVWTKIQICARSYNFVVDTGAAASVVGLETASACQMKLGSSLKVAGVGSAARGYHLPHFQGSLHGLPLARSTIALDLEYPSRLCSKHVDGLLGADFFRGKIVQIDCAQKVMRVLDAFSPRPDGNTLPLKFMQGAMCLPVSVGGCQPCWVRLDTGCTDALHWGPIGTGLKTLTPTIALAGSRSSTTLLPVQIGNQLFSAVPTTLHKSAIFPGEAGLLGNAILARLRITIDTIKNRVTLESPPSR